MNKIDEMNDEKKMMETVRGVPVPSLKRRGAKAIYPWASIEPGAAFKFPEWVEFTSARSMASNAGNAHDKKFIVRKNENNEIWCWRIDRTGLQIQHGNYREIVVTTDNYDPTQKDIEAAVVGADPDSRDKINHEENKIEQEVKRRLHQERVKDAERLRKETDGKGIHDKKGIHGRLMTIEEKETAEQKDNKMRSAARDLIIKATVSPTARKRPGVPDLDCTDNSLNTTPVEEAEERMTDEEWEALVRTGDTI